MSENKNACFRPNVPDSEPIPLKLGQNTRASEPVPSHITSVQSGGSRASCTQNVQRASVGLRC